MTSRFPTLSPPVSYPPASCPPKPAPLRPFRRPELLTSLPLMELSLFAALGFILALG